MSKAKKPPRPPANPVERYHGVSSILSVARHLGGAKVMGSHYHWDPVADTLVREDVLKAEGLWYAMRAGEKGKPDEYLGDPCPTRAEALRRVKADRSGRRCCLFGPGGLAWPSFIDGKPDTGGAG